MATAEFWHSPLHHGNYLMLNDLDKTVSNIGLSRPKLGPWQLRTWTFDVIRKSDSNGAYDKIKTST